ncbi:TetR family transcriptional regulator [Mycobacterium sp. Root265]|uniref:TetR/AcrR family transcriptional regulator n=1 Tax=Mycobacterium sp. Root265 TaxID=1736504 RepID=UPI00070EA265|nr:TetR/AcrR family transcriptional regulator [Mycobacterium sp. Root265]KRD05342.1 TetR family transcriptional regulator [Mycobacterium sp. Root265]
MAPTDRFRARKQPRQQRSAQTRRDILDAAARVFSEHGYAAGTTNRIAAAADVSIGSLYQYFPNKDAILAALSEAHIDAGTTLLTERLRDGLPAALEDLVRLFVRAAIDNHRDDPSLHRVLFEEAPRSAALLNRLHDTEARGVAGVTELLRHHPEVRVTDPDFAARLTIATVESLVHRLIGAPVDTGQLEDEVVRLLTSYLSAAVPAAAPPPA